MRAVPVLSGAGAACAVRRSRARFRRCGFRVASSGHGSLRAIVSELSLTRVAGQFNRNAAHSEPLRARTVRESCPVLVMSR